MAVTDRIRRIGDRTVALVGPAQLTKPLSQGSTKLRARSAGITRSVDQYEITLGAAGTEAKAYTVTLRPFSQNGFRARHRGVGMVELLRQPNGVAAPTTATTTVAARTPKSTESPLTLGPVTCALGDRLFVLVERRQTSGVSYQLEVDAT